MFFTVLLDHGLVIHDQPSGLKGVIGKPQGYRLLITCASTPRQQQRRRQDLGIGCPSFRHLLVLGF